MNDNDIKRLNRDILLYKILSILEFRFDEDEKDMSVFFRGVDFEDPLVIYLNDFDFYYLSKALDESVIKKNIKEYFYD